MGCVPGPAPQSLLRLSWAAASSRCRVMVSLRLFRTTADAGGCTSWAPRVPRLINLLRLVFLSFFFVLLLFFFFFFFFSFVLRGLLGLLLGLRLGFFPVSELVRTQGDQL